MENIPSGDMAPKNKSEQVLSVSQQVGLAETLLEAIDKLEVSSKSQGGFDAYADSGQYVPEIKNAHDEREEAIEKARQEFDENTPNKEEFVKKLKDIGENDIADRIAKMFGVKN